MASIQSKKSTTGGKTFYVVVSFGGKHKWIKAGTLGDAKKMKRQIESLENSQRIEKLGLTQQTVRIDDFFQDYADHVRLHTAPNTVKRYKAALNAFLAFLRLFHPGIKYLSQITPEIIEDYQRRRLESVEVKREADGVKPGVHKGKRLPLPQTVNYEVSVLRSSFIWAHDRELIPSVPTRKVKKLKPRATRKARMLSEKDCAVFLKTAESMAKSEARMRVYHLAFKFLLNTGLRSGELCNLVWDDVNLKTGLLKIQEKDGWSPKSYAREFFMNATTLKLLTSLRDGGKPPDYVFKDHTGKKLDTDSLRKALIRVAEAAGFEGFTRVHDLRHTFNSLMQMNGVDPATMARILGHRDLETTMIYTHQTAEHLKKSIERVGI